mmetsp:Transcript_33018/g.72414  ORF Transcript_33018/g.72414 Transcript_33018/m.72414 type:complete len:137 (-) Transcript_33018:340-750(-)
MSNSNGKDGNDAMDGRHNTRKNACREKRIGQASKMGENEMNGTGDVTSASGAVSRLSRTSASPSPSSSSLAPQSARECRILSELTASVHALESISEVLDDIMQLTDPNPSSASTESIAVKQSLLLEELRQWSNVVT